MLTLVILSAGCGSRFGGNKSLQPVGPNDQCLFYYAVYDAILTGFTHCVFVVNEQTDRLFVLQQLQEFEHKISISFAVQKTAFGTENLTRYQQRKKPWGTAHAILCAEHLIHSPFAVINADDFYGRESFQLVSADLDKHQTESYGVMPGYSLGNTSSTAGSVNRGICSVNAAGHLESIVEVHSIIRDPQGNWYSDNAETNPQLHAMSIVSMTFWGFQIDIFRLIRAEWLKFLDKEASNPNAEFYIPSVVNSAVENGQLSLRVLHTHAKWMGMTYKEDIANVKEKLKILHQTGVYTPSL